MAQGITNAEKYAEQIAHLIADDPSGDVCAWFAKGIDFYGGIDCNTCPLKGKCNNLKDLKEWLVRRHET